MFKSKSSIQAKFLNKMLIIVFVSIGLWCLIWIHDEYDSFKDESESLRAEYTQSQKLILKKEVAQVVAYINDMRKQSEQKLEMALKERVYEAHDTAMNIYRQNADSKNLPEIVKMIKDALRPIRFNGGRGYYFASSMDGIDQLYPVSPEFEGKNLIDLQDSKGNFVIQDEIDIVKTKNEGFVTHFWPMPGENPSVLYPKISFVKYFKPLNWYFGTGEYLEKAKEQIQKEALNRIVNLRFGTEGYFFGSTYKGGALFSNGKITIGSGSVWNLTDPDGVKIIQEQRKTAENPEGGFVYYSWNKLKSEAPSPKISFVQGIPEWEWTIGAGVYLDTIEKTISGNKTVLIVGLKKRIARSVLILAVLLCLIYFWFRRISSQIQKSVDTFSSFLDKSSIESTTIDPDDIQLGEFREIAISTNKMLADRRKAEEALRESEELFSLFMDFLPAHVFIKDETSKTLFVNKHMNDVLGAKDWMGKTPLELFPKDLARAMIADDKKTMNEGFQGIVETVPDKHGINHIYRTYKFRINRLDNPPLLGG
ncbi:MAG: cache domain-containing protein, partial [Proteobacteria bacterium]|nr:cache domain-containing protein [Pseudomonadota bacterium]MBU1584572.1 cache domain-containing protein [Pseudomonadota bacterium]